MIFIITAEQILQFLLITCIVLQCHVVNTTTDFPPPISCRERKSSIIQEETTKYFFIISDLFGTRQIRNYIISN